MTVAPELAVEVIGPIAPWASVLKRVDDLFSAGVKRVWAISDANKQIYVYHAPDQVAVVASDSTLTDEELLPGFLVAVDDLFGA